MSEEITTMESGKPARTLEQVTQEIRYLDSQAKRLVLGHAIEIGRRLTEAKAMVPYGGWGEYIEKELEYSQSTAQNFMRIFDEYGAAQQSLFGPVAESETLGKLSYTKALKLLAVPREEREEFAREVNAEHLSTRELEQAIRERDEARKRAEEAEKAAKELDRDLEQSQEAVFARDKTLQERDGKIFDLEKELDDLRSRTVDVAVQEPDPEEIERRAKEMAQAAQVKAEQDAVAAIAKAKQEAKDKLKKAEEKAKAEREKLEAQLKAAEEKLTSAGATDRAEAEQLRATVESLKKQLAMSGQEITAFRLRFTAWQEAYRAMREALGNVPEENRSSMEAAVRTQAKAWMEDI